MCPEHEIHEFDHIMGVNPRKVYVYLLGLFCRYPEEGGNCLDMACMESVWHAWHA